MIRFTTLPSGSRCMYLGSTKFYLKLWFSKRYTSYDLYVDRLARRLWLDIGSFHLTLRLGRRRDD